MKTNGTGLQTEKLGAGVINLKNFQVGIRKHRPRSHAI